MAADKIFAVIAILYPAASQDLYLHYQRFGGYRFIPLLFFTDKWTMAENMRTKEPSGDSAPACDFEFTSDLTLEKM